MQCAKIKFGQCAHNGTESVQWESTLIIKESANEIEVVDPCGIPYNYEHNNIIMGSKSTFIIQ